MHNQKKLAPSSCLDMIFVEWVIINLWKLTPFCCGSATGPNCDKKMIA